MGRCHRTGNHLGNFKWTDYCLGIIKGRPHLSLSPFEDLAELLELLLGVVNPVNAVDLGLLQKVHVPCLENLESVEDVRIADRVGKVIRHGKDLFCGGCLFVDEDLVNPTVVVEAKDVGEQMLELFIKVLFKVVVGGHVG